MAAFLALGFLIGMQHALEADHLAAVGSMLDGSSSRRRLVFRGAVWGLGHSITLLLICSAVILTGMKLTDQLSSALEFLVGVMLVILGLDVLRKIRSAHIHIHVHSHAGSGEHIHAHSHQHKTVSYHHRSEAHEHPHRTGFPVKALAIGLLHGSAGSAGLLALAAAATQQPAVAIVYVVLFAAGSMLGMAALSLIVAWPLGRIERSAMRIHQGLMLAVAAITLFLGANIMFANSRWIPGLS